MKKNTSINNWLIRHAQVSISSLGYLFRNSIATLMTTMVIGIAIALPAGMWVILNNAQQLGNQWDGTASISAFLKIDLTEKQIQNLAMEFDSKQSIKSVEIISRDDAMTEFKQYSGFGQALDMLTENPLPPVLIITPTEQHSQPEQISVLLSLIEKNELVEFAELDLEWVKRLHAITEIAARGIWILATLLAMAVILIIGNTIRLEIQNRKDEIEIIRLVGASNAFIQRPLLYTGFLYGLLGGIIGWLFVNIALWLISSPIERLSGLYQSSFGLNFISIQSSLALLFISSLMGWLGAKIAVKRHLQKIEPE